MTDSLAAAVAKLVRAMPRNPDVIAVDEALKAKLTGRSVVSTTVVSTQKPGAVVSTVVSTSCPSCKKRRAAKREAMKIWRAKSNIQNSKKISV